MKLPADRYADGPRMRDLQAFFVETERESAARMSEVLRDLGFEGLISTYNNWPTVQTALSRRDVEAVTMNTYHDWVGGYSPGSALRQVSSLADGVDYMRMIAAARWLGKPFIVSEYDHLFWNRYRYEAGLVMPVYAGLQGWDVLCRHGHGPIALSYGEPYPHKGRCFLTQSRSIRWHAPAKRLVPLSFAAATSRAPLSAFPSLSAARRT